MGPSVVSTMWVLHLGSPAVQSVQRCQAMSGALSPVMTSGR
jgi:hypothetical protein